MNKKVIVNFIVISMLLLTLGVISIIKMADLSDMTENLHDHPFTVVKATQSIQSNFMAMHRYMDEITLAENDEEIDAAVQKINSAETVMNEQFDLIFERYLGDKNDINQSYAAFLEWKPIRDEVISLMHEGKKSEAGRLTKGREHEHIEHLNAHIQKLISNAQLKADNILASSIQTKQTTILVILVVIVGILLILLITKFVLLKNFSKNEKKIRQQEEALLIRSRMAQMGELLSMIAHQWRQPISAISAAISGVRLKLGLGTYDLENEKDREACQAFLVESLDQMEGLIQTLTNTVGDFRNYYKPNKEVSSVLISKPIENAFNIVEASFVSEGIALTKEYESHKEINIRENEIMQMILNILQNAQDNFKERNIVNPKIRVSTKDIDGGVQIEVCDNGGGIEDSILDKIFDSYFSTKDEKHGTGIGLYMSQTIIEEHHDGTIEAINRDEGVCFIIKLTDKK